MDRKLLFNWTPEVFIDLCIYCFNHYECLVMIHDIYQPNIFGYNPINYQLRQHVIKEISYYVR